MPRIPPVEDPQIKSNLLLRGSLNSSSSFFKKVAEDNPLTPPPSKESTYFVIF